MTPSDIIYDVKEIIVDWCDGNKIEGPRAVWWEWGDPQGVDVYIYLEQLDTETDVWMEVDGPVRLRFSAAT